MSDLIKPDCQFVVFDDVRLYHQVLGRDSDKLLIIFTHGGGPSITVWSNFRRNAQALVACHQCCFLDFI